MPHPSSIHWSFFSATVLLLGTVSGSAGLAQTPQFSEALKSATEQQDAPRGKSKVYSDAAGAHTSANATVLNTRPATDASGNFIIYKSSDQAVRESAQTRGERATATAPGGLEALKARRPAEDSGASDGSNGK